VIVTAGTKIPEETLRGAFGARSARPAPADAVNASTDYAASLVAPLLLPEDMPVLIDQRAVDRFDMDDVVYTATGEPSTALGIGILDLLAISGAKPVELAGPAGGRGRTRSIVRSNRR